MSNFASTLVAWQKHSGRHGLPWQGTREPYLIWLSEVMLQQTQVAAVIPYYERFLKKFPTVKALAADAEDEVLKLWSGLGYYARGRNLHRAAQKIAFELGGKFPRTAEKLAELPGVGRSTAAAIAAFAYGERAAILDGNVKRVLARHFHLRDDKQLWARAQSLLPDKGIEAYTQALMDLGATLCVRKKPRCGLCPVARSCIARKKGVVDQFPAPRAKKALPVRKTTWWVLLQDDSVLLERRPSRGLWGGLLTFPEARLKGCEVVSRKKLPVVEHGFTHFRLLAAPVLCRLKGAQKRFPGFVWLKLPAAVQGAVPAPVKKLLRVILSP